jgi:cell division septum initiation protein DivIVA
MVRSEFDEFKDLCSKSDDVKKKYATLTEKLRDKNKQVRELENKIGKYRGDNEYLITKLANANLKLKEYEEAKSMDKISSTTEEE